MFFILSLDFCPIGLKTFDELLFLLICSFIRFSNWILVLLYGRRDVFHEISGRKHTYHRRGGGIRVRLDLRFV